MLSTVVPYIPNHGLPHRGQDSHVATPPSPHIGCHTRSSKSTRLSDTPGPGLAYVAPEREVNIRLASTTITTHIETYKHFGFFYDLCWEAILGFDR